MKPINCKTFRNQDGYLHEIPLLTVVIAVVCAILVNVLPKPWNLIPVVVFVVAVGLFLYYNFVRPGWLPGEQQEKSSDETDTPSKRR